MRRFLVSPDELRSSTAVITGDVFHHMTKVLRLKPGSRVRLADGTGAERSGVIAEIGRDTVTVDLTEGSTITSCSPSPAITIYQGLPKGEKLDLIVQKATELGAAAIVPFAAERSIKKMKPDRLDELLGRCQRIAREAARQSESRLVPEIRLAPSVQTALAMQNHDVKILLWEQEHTHGLKQLVDRMEKPESVGVIIGPEGGLTTNEVAAAKAAGYVSVSLGKRILRTETAALAVLSILQFCWGDIGVADNTHETEEA